MSTDLEQSLRSGMERFTEDIGTPHGLARKAYRHRQKRRMTARAATAATAATALTAGALAVAGVTRAAGPAGGHHGQATQTAADAYVVTRVEHALAQPALGNDLEYARTVFQPGTTLQAVGPAVLQISHRPGPGSPWAVGYAVHWMYHGAMRMSALAPGGQPVFDLSIAATGTAPGRSIMVIYHNKSWWQAPLPRDPGGGPGPVACRPGIELGPGPGNGWPAFIRGELKCGGLAVTGRQVVDGIDAIKITGARSGITLWVSPSTYLPVRLILGRAVRQTDFQWLAPTPANLAHMKVQVPAGFRQVPAPK